MKLGILGTGMIVQDLLRTFDKLPIESTYILGTKATEKEAEELVKKYQLSGFFLDYDEMLASEIDTVYIALPNNLHYSFAIQALNSNKHAIIEKPIVTNDSQLLQLEAVAKNNGLILLEAMNIHYLPAFKQLKEDIKEIGNIRIASLNYSQYSSRYDAFKSGDVHPAFDPQFSGGALMDINVYNIHAAIGLFGKPVKAIYYPNIQRGIDTSGVVNLIYDDKVVTTIGAKDCYAPIISTIQGDKSTIEISQSINTISKYKVKTRTEIIKEYENIENKHRLYYEFIEFCNMIDNNLVEESRKYLQCSLDVAEVMTCLRKQVGLVFPGDNIK